MRLTDKQWEKIKSFVPDGPVRSDGKGRPWKDKRDVLEGMLWVVKTGARWRTFQKTTRRTRLATIGFSSGWKKVSVIK